MLTDMGAQYYPMLPIRPLRGQLRRIDMRNHRKIVVIDGLIAHAGSQNLIVDHYHLKKNIARGLHWRELVARFEGPIVRELDAVFITDWVSESGELLQPNRGPVVLADQPGDWDAQVVPSGPSFENDNNLKLFAAVIQNAKRRVNVTSPYFVPDESIMLAMVTAASRGLDVELFVSEVSDQFAVFHAQRSYYEQLLRPGKDLPPRGADRAARQAREHRRGRRDHRLKQLRHPLPQPAHGGDGPGARAGVRRRDAPDRGRLPGQQPTAHAGGVAATASAGESVRQPDAPHVLTDVAMRLATFNIWNGRFPASAGSTSTGWPIRSERSHRTSRRCRRSTWTSHKPAMPILPRLSRKP